MNETFYKNKQILITGHTGFVGSWLTLWLSSVGADVVGFSLNPPSTPYFYKMLKFGNKVTNIRGDIKKKDKIESVVKEYAPEIVIHLAAQPILLKSYVDPVNTYLTNAVGTLNLLEANRKNDDLKAILNVTSDKVYENVGQTKGYAETDRLGGYDPYSSSKTCSEVITSAYRDSFYNGTGIATARAGNIIGGGDWGENRLIPGLIESAIKKKTILIRHPKSIRPWTHILDILNGYLILTEKICKNPSQYSGQWNFSSRYTKSVAEVIDELTEYFKVKYKIKFDKRHEENILLLDPSKSEEILAWESVVSFREAIKSTAEWYKEFYNNRERIQEYSLKEIKRFGRLYG